MRPVWDPSRRERLSIFRFPIDLTFPIWYGSTRYISIDSLLKELKLTMTKLNYEVEFWEIFGRNILREISNKSLIEKLPKDKVIQILEDQIQLYESRVKENEDARGDESLGTIALDFCVLPKMRNILESLKVPT